MGRNPHGIHIDGLELTPLASNTPSASTDDFFDTWDKPAATKPSPAAAKSPAAPPSIGAKANAPRTVTSSSLRGTPITRPAATSRLSSSTTSTSTGPKSSKLGAKKATTSINFEEAQKKAVEEEERIKRLGYDKQREEEEAKAVREREAAERKKRGEESRSATPLSATGSSAAKRDVVVDKPQVARLGFGQTIGAPVVAQPKT